MKCEILIEVPPISQNCKTTPPHVCILHEHIHPSQNIHQMKTTVGGQYILLMIFIGEYTTTLQNCWSYQLLLPMTKFALDHAYFCYVPITYVGVEDVSNYRIGSLKPVDS